MKEWRAIARSAVGVGHQKQNIPCQDFGAYSLIAPDVMVGAVSDGAGSAKFSDRGAEIAVETSILLFQKYSKDNYDERWEPTLERVKKIFEHILKHILKKIKQEAQNLNCDYRELACTLLVFLATPHGMMAMQIGDGFIVARPYDGELQLLFNPDKGEYINETTFVTSSNAIEEMQVQVFDWKPYFICASTDGLENVAIEYKNSKPFNAFFSPLEEYLEETLVPEEEDKYIQDFLNSERLNTRTHDDKTLLLGLLTEPTSMPEASGTTTDELQIEETEQKQNNKQSIIKWLTERTFPFIK
ncbi:MAG: PP2C family serine/threonine-protein phosphatase [Cyanobacterium sp.]